MVVDERFGALLDGSQGDAMDDSGGQGVLGVFVGGDGSTLGEVLAERSAVGGKSVGGAKLSQSQRRQAANRLKWAKSNQ